MSDHYPASEEIIEESEKLEGLYSELALLEDARRRGFVKFKVDAKGVLSALAFDPSFGREKYVPANKNETYKDPIPPDYIHSLKVVRTEVYDFDTDTQSTLEVDPNNPEHLKLAMARLASDQRISKKERTGVQEAWDKIFSQFETTTGISLHFRSQMDEEVKRNFLSPTFLKGYKELASRRDQYAEDVGIDNAASKAHALRYPGFHERYRECFVAINNYKLTLAAVEKNREFDPITKQPFGFNNKEGLTYDKFREMAKASATEAFAMAKATYAINNRYSKTRAFIKSSSARLEREIREIATGAQYDIGILSGFLKESKMSFKPKTGEKPGEASKRFKKAYKAFANKKLDDLEKNHGLQTILAIASARALGKDTVGKIDLDRAASVILEARRTPGSFTTTKKLIDRLTGGDAKITSELMPMLDGRRSFLRNVDRIARFGQSASRIGRGDSRVTKQDREEGQRFAASTFLRSMTRGETLAQAMLQEFKRSNLTQAAIKASASLSDVSRRLLNQLMQPMTRNEAHRRAKVEATVEQDRPAGLKNDQGKAPGQGPEQNSPGMKPRR